MSKVVHLKTASATRRAQRIRALLEDRDNAEKEIAEILREQLDELGERNWLAWCGEEFGWARSTAYRHLSPEQVERERENSRTRAATSRTTRHEPAQSPRGFDHFTRTDGEVKAACDYNAEDPADVAEEGDSEEDIRHRIFIYHADESHRHAVENGFKNAAPSEITSDIMRAAARAAKAWADVVAYLNSRAKE